MILMFLIGLGRHKRIKNIQSAGEPPREPPRDAAAIATRRA